jgi:hypothetical protein
MRRDVNCIVRRRLNGRGAATEFPAGEFQAKGRFDLIWHLDVESWAIRRFLYFALRYAIAKSQIVRLSQARTARTRISKSLAHRMATVYGPSVSKVTSHCDCSSDNDSEDSLDPASKMILTRFSH